MNGSFVDHLSKDKLCANKEECVSLRVEDGDVERFMSYLGDRVKSGDCIQFADGRAIIYYVGDDVHGLCRAYRLAGNNTRIFVASEADLNTVQARQ